MKSFLARIKSDISVPSLCFSCNIFCGKSRASGGRGCGSWVHAAEESQQDVHHRICNRRGFPAHERYIDASPTKAMLVLAGLITLGAFSNLLISYFDIYTNSGNSPETLTGRIGIWIVILTESIQQPWIGHGFHAVWNVIPPFGDFEARHAHNELIQQLYAYGVVGVCMLAGLYGSFYHQVRRLAAGPTRTLWLALLVFVLVRGLTDTEPFDLCLPLWAVVMLSSLIEDERGRQSDLAGSAGVVNLACALPTGYGSTAQ